MSTHEPDETTTYPTSSSAYLLASLTVALVAVPPVVLAQHTAEKRDRVLDEGGSPWIEYRDGFQEVKGKGLPKEAVQAHLDAMTDEGLHCNSFDEKLHFLGSGITYSFEANANTWVSFFCDEHCEGLHVRFRRARAPSSQAAGTGTIRQHGLVEGVPVFGFPVRLASAIRGSMLYQFHFGVEGDDGVIRPIADQRYSLEAKNYRIFGFFWRKATFGWLASCAIEFE